MSPVLPSYFITTHRTKCLPERFPAHPGLSSRTVSVGAAGSAQQYPDHVRLTAFWSLMSDQFGEMYAQSVARDYVFSSLGGRTVERALADGVDAKVVWRAVCDTFNVPENRR